MSAGFDLVGDRIVFKGEGTASSPTATPKKSPAETKTAAKPKTPAKKKAAARASTKKRRVQEISSSSDDDDESKGGTISTGRLGEDDDESKGTVSIERLGEENDDKINMLDSRALRARSATVKAEAAKEETTEDED